MDNTCVYDRTGVKYTLIHPPKKGGEGEVFKLSENPALCAKIYYRNIITEEIRDKITSMTDNPPACDLTEHNKNTRSASIAWPVSELYKYPGRKDFCGFLMPVIDTELFREAHMYYDPQDRNKYLSGSFTWKYLLTTAYNIAYTVSAIHRSGHCIGDMSGSNILVARTAAISIIDCDSFQIENKKTGKKYFTKVATGDYLAPELMGINFRTENIDRYYSDLFSLSILIFKFLMNGVHPFQARGKGVEDYPTTEHKIKNGIFPYLRNVRQIYPPLYAPPYAILSPEIRALFERCFVKGIDKPYMRPDADEWVTVLQDELSGLKQCDNNPNHWHSGHLQICPWCEILKIKKKEYFPYNGPKTVKPKTKVPNAKITSPDARTPPEIPADNNSTGIQGLNKYQSKYQSKHHQKDTKTLPDTEKSSAAIKTDIKTDTAQRREPALKNSAVKTTDPVADAGIKAQNTETKKPGIIPERQRVIPEKPEIIEEKPENREIILLKPEIRPQIIDLKFDPDCDNKAEIEIINRNQDPLEITAEPLHRWILLPEKNFSVRDKKIIEITVERSYFESRPAGIKYKSWIQFKTPAGSEKTEINVSLQKEPILTVIPDKRLLFRGIKKPDINRADNDAQKTVQSIEITNSGERTLNGEITSDNRWIKAEPENFSIQGKQKIDVSIIPEYMSSKAIQTGRITVRSNGGRCDIRVIASLK
ncbi:helix-hairpin-helix domain-containing protein [Methanoplanus endosymbiosus]|uniref:Protein kinase domain-containing protein n=1 Tax=Methanoplanus endosymbiosus TaxID=33865 RepID=A0A9E7TJQ4_9EURY|nr:hypothetical protein [Methanoplanus endosymbiosus]UUX92054.1 hypothetical protein L6E24_11920 [Methanoplanus endosymbiosus]